MDDMGIVYPIIYIQGFLYVPGGWERDFWTINSIIRRKNSVKRKDFTHLTFRSTHSEIPVGTYHGMYLLAVAVID